jgi:hypothetical protein
VTQPTRIGIGVLVLLVIVGVILGIDALQRQSNSNETLQPGEIPIYVNQTLAGRFSPDDLARLDKTSFVDPEEGKTQEGWLLRDVILLSVEESSLKADALITVSSSSRNKSAQLSWAEVNDPANKVMFDLSNRGTLKLASLLDKLDTRDEWVQDVDKIEIIKRP